MITAALGLKLMWLVSVDASDFREAEMNPHRQVFPDGKVLRFDVTEV